MVCASIVIGTKGNARRTMNRTELDKAIAAKEFEYLESIAKLIADNPTVTLADLRQQHGITY